MSLSFTVAEANRAGKAAEGLGGVRLSEKCVGQLTLFKKPKKVRINTCACGNDLKIALPYDLDPKAVEKDAASRGGGLVRFCLICDHGIQFPRMIDAMEDLA